MRTEKTLAIVFLIGLLFKLLHWPGAGPLLVLSLTLIGMLYFPAGFYFFCDKVIKKQNIAFSIIAGLFLSLIPLGILFKIMYWPGAHVYLLASTVTAPIILAVNYFLKSRAEEDLKIYYSNMFLRTAILTVFTIIFFLTPTATLLKIQYWDDPELANLKTRYYTEPDNEAYKKEHDAYLLKRDSLYLQNSNN